MSSQNWAASIDPFALRAGWLEWARAITSKAKDGEFPPSQDDLPVRPME